MEKVPDSTPEISPTEQTQRWRNRMAYGPGGFAENYAVNSIAQLVNPVFAIALGVNPAWVGVAMAIPRLVDAFTDPLMGGISDNWKGRWGRRRPFIIAGAIISGLIVALFWWTPVGASSQFHFVWLLSFLLLSTVGTTMFGVPYAALGLEARGGKNEVTGWMAWRSFYHKSSGVLVQWLFLLVQLSFLGGIVSGARVIGLVGGILIAVLGSIPALFLREDPRHRPAIVRIPIWKSWGLTLRNRNFLILATVAVLIFMSVLLVDTLGFFLQVYYVFGGDTYNAGIFKGVGGTTFHLTGIASLPLITMLSKRLGKKRAFNLCILSIVSGGLAKYFCYYPGSGYLIILPNLLLAPGLVAVLVLVPSMLADVAAQDEAERGSSRHGMFAASMNWFQKLSLSGVAFVSGFILLAAGWEQDLGADQVAGTFVAMRWTFALGTIALALAAAALLSLYRPPELRGED